MAFAKGNESKEAVVFPKYVGVAPVYVLGVNPDKEEYEKILGSELQKEPEYLSTIEIDGKNVDNARISFVVKTDAEKVDAEVISNLTFFLQKRPRVGSQTGKYQVIDKYGDTAWAVRDEDFKFEDGKMKVIRVPQYAHGPANIDIDYRLAYVGEEELTAFLKNFLCIPSRMAWVNSTWVPNNKVDIRDCEARLENIDDYFKGNFKELRDIISLMPKNKVRVLFGVRTTDKGQFQTVLSSKTLRNSVSNYNDLAKYVEERKLNGAFKDIEYPVVEFREYAVKPTEFNTSTKEMPKMEDDLPFGPSSDTPDW